MAHKTTKSTKKTTRTTSAKAASTSAKVRKVSATRKKATVAQKVDYYPNRVAFLTAVAAVVVMFSFALASVLLLKS